MALRDVLVLVSGVHQGITPELSASSQVSQVMTRRPFTTPHS